MPYLPIFYLKFEKGIVIIEINTLGFFLTVKFRAKMKVFKSRVKNALFGCYKQHLRVFIQALK